MALAIIAVTHDSSTEGFAVLYDCCANDLVVHNWEGGGRGKTFL